MRILSRREGCKSRTSSISCRRRSSHTVVKKTSNATPKEEDLVAVAAKHTSKNEEVAARSIVLVDDEVSTCQWELGATSHWHLQMGTMRAVGGKFFATAEADLEQAHQQVSIGTLSRISIELASWLEECHRGPKATALAARWVQ